MIKPIDTHAHLHFASFEQDRTEVIERAKKALSCLINVGTDLDSSRQSLALVKKEPTFFTSIGIHPHEAEKLPPNWSKEFEKLLCEQKVVAVGECGLDYFESPGYKIPDKKRQKELFIAQIRLAKKFSLPVIIHCRQAWKDTLDILDHEDTEKAVFHCWTGSPELVPKVINKGFYISFAGNITYKSSLHIRESLKVTPSDRLLLETDSPFLPTSDRRGMRNEPIYVRIIANLISEIKNWSISKTIEITNKNAKRIFSL